MALSSPIQEVSKFLESYWNRTRVFRVLQYASTMVGGLLEQAHPDTADSLVTVSGSISRMLVMLRLLDDIPALSQTVLHIRPQKNQGGVTAVLDLLSSLLGQVYYPIEHLAWAADNRLLPLKSKRLWVLGTMLWVVSLLVSCLRALATILKVNEELYHCENVMHPNGKKKVTFEDQRTGGKARVSALRRQRLLAALTVVQSLSDLMNAVHWLPEGFLWAGRLSLFWVGLFGTVSSLIGLYKILPTGVHRSLSNQR